MNRKLLVLVTGMGLAAAAGSAAAQEVDAVEGRGYPVGEGTVVHPTVGAELGFTDNVFYEAGHETPRAAGIFRLLVRAALASKDLEAEEAPDPFLDPGEEPAAEPAAQALSYRVGGGLRFDEYLHAASGVRAQRNLAADLKGQVTVAPQGKVAFSAEDHFIRDTRPTNFESSDHTNRIINDLGLGLMVQPGGRTLRGGVKWQNRIDFFEDPDQRFANRMINALRARAEWDFFPYSMLHADFTYSFVGGLAGNELGGMPYTRSAQPIRGGLGIATAITEPLTIKAHLGWAYASYTGGASYNVPVAGVELGFRYSPVGRVVAEYNYDHRDSINADFYRDHHFGGRIDHQFGRVLASARGELRLRRYQGVSPALGGVPDRHDLILAAGARAQYVLRDWMAAVLEYRGDVVQTAYRTMVGGFIDDPSYIRHELSAGVRAAF
jgi:hypothetical protein